MESPSQVLGHFLNILSEGLTGVLCGFFYVHVWLYKPVNCHLIRLGTKSLMSDACHLTDADTTSATLCMIAADIALKFPVFDKFKRSIELKSVKCYPGG